MTRYLIVTLMLISTCSFGQVYKIKGLQTDSIFIGIDNPLYLEGYTRHDKTSIKTSRNIRCRKAGRHNFILNLTRPFQNDSIFILKDDKIIDTIILSGYRLKLDQFVMTDTYGLIRSGIYSADILKQLNSIKVIINVPWIEPLKINRYIIEILSKEEQIIFSKAIYNQDKINDQEIKTALSKLKSGEIIRIKRIMARTPYDDGERPKNFNFIVK